MEELIEALRHIADNRVPCRECGEPHEYRKVCGESSCNRKTWKHPDGHAYFRMDPSEYAAAVLEELDDTGEE